jgi:uncharacterized membrane protein
LKGKEMSLMVFESKQDKRNVFFCALAVAVAVIACVPILEMGINDDWSYSLIARDLAKTGRLIYNGWATPIVGLQAVWAALFIKIFGFSYTLVRLTTLPLAMGCAALIYAIQRRLGIVPKIAVFGTMAVCLSPIFINLSVSFMTDIPGLTFILLCTYCTIRALEYAEKPEEGRHTRSWLMMLAVAGVLGGTIRQSVWIMLPTCFLCFLWFFRRGKTPEQRSEIAVTAAILLVLSLVAVGSCLFWFERQPKGLTEAFGENIAVLLRGLPHTLFDSLKLMGLSCAFFLLPILLYVLPTSLSVLTRRFGPWLTTFIIGFEVLLTFFGRVSLAPRLLLGNLVTTHGMLGAGETTLGSRPLILPESVFFCWYYVVGICSLTVVSTMLATIRRRRTTLSPSPTILWVVAVGYILIFLPRFASDSPYDRYMLPLVVIFAILILRWRQDVAREKENGLLPSVSGWVYVALHAFLGIAITHDYIACLRAELQVASYLTEHLGIPRTSLSGGFEYDCTTQVTKWGYLNDKRIHPKALYKEPEETTEASGFSKWWYAKTPVIKARYFVVLSPQENLKNTDFPSTRYHSWLPPGHQEVFVQQSP